jgi:tetratricopeptide (TPR) repeat protein
MAKKRSAKETKRKRAKRLEARSQRLKLVEEPADLPRIPDRRIIERALRGLGTEHKSVSPVSRAQEIMYDAWESRDGTERMALAFEALNTSGDCADAYLLLAEEVAESLETITALHYAAVAAGERALGERTFEEDVGYFWGILETRPYMRARAGLAQCLWTMGKREDAVDHYKDMLRLNPNDNQGLRHLLLAWLLVLDRDAEAKALLDDFAEEPTAIWAYSSALLSFREQGDTPETRALLAEALERNPHVPKYLLGRKKLPRLLPEYMGLGDENEAVSYASENIDNWKKTKGALELLKEVAG